MLNLKGECRFYALETLANYKGIYIGALTAFTTPQFVLHLLFHYRSVVLQFITYLTLSFTSPKLSTDRTDTACVQDRATRVVSQNINYNSIVVMSNNRT